MYIEKKKIIDNSMDISMNADNYVKTLAREQERKYSFQAVNSTLHW
ncbi:MAG: hypothetical protein HPY74_01770 [Firmicutes bacterium]|nr:hypothetical protein [Bacillota bacterium]